MRKALMLLILPLAACGGNPTPEEKAADDAAAVAMVEKAQKMRAPPRPLALEPISEADSAAAAISGAGCSFVPEGQSQPVLVGDTERAIIKTADVPTTFAVDVGTAATSHHYVGRTHTAFIDQAGDKGQPWGEEGIKASGVLTVQDTDKREVYRARGTVYCGA